MDKETFLRKMKEAVNNPRLTALFVSLQMSAATTDKHYYEDFCGFQLLQSYTSSFDNDLLEQAIRKFDYIQEIDLKYVRAISYYGKAIAYAYYQTGEAFGKSYEFLNQLINLSTYWGTDRSEFIEELQTESRHLKQDIMEWDKELNPITGMFRSWFN